MHFVIPPNRKLRHFKGTSACMLSRQKPVTRAHVVLADTHRSFATPTPLDRISTINGRYAQRPEEIRIIIYGRTDIIKEPQPPLTTAGPPRVSRFSLATRNSAPSKIFLSPGLVHCHRVKDTSPPDPLCETVFLNETESGSRSEKKRPYTKE